MPTMLTKSQKHASELAELIRQSLAKPDLRLAVFATKNGWRAKVYPEIDEDVARVQVLVDKKVAALSDQFELIE
jgi:hypothetical protein